METVQKDKAIAALVRAFFNGFSTGLLDAANKDNEEVTPQLMKKIVMQHYESIAPTFHELVFLPMSRFNYSEDEHEELIKKVESSGTDNYQKLMEIVCRTDEAYNLMVESYKYNFANLLCGYMPRLKNHLTDYFKGCDGETVEQDLAITSVGETAMKAYVSGFKQGGGDESTIIEDDFEKLCKDALMALLADSSMADDIIASR